MPKSPKRFALAAHEIKRLAPGYGGCIATDLITVAGRRVGYMYRELSDRDMDSGWAFMAGSESPAYMDDPDNHGIYDVNTIANYDPEIIPLLDTPAPCAFERVGDVGEFVEVDPPGAE